MPGGPSEAPLRDRIREVVERHPGSSGRDVQRRLGAAWGETAYHLERLTRAGEIRRERGGWRDYYFSRELTWADRRILQALQSPAERRLLVAVLEGRGSTFTELADGTGLARSTASFHLARLVELGLLELPPAAGGRAYVPVDPERIRRLLPERADIPKTGLVDRFAETFAGLMHD